MFQLSDAEANEAAARCLSGHGKTGELWGSMERRAMACTGSPSLLSPNDTNDWWHLVWERLSTSAFVQRIRPEERLGAWLKAIVLDIVEKPADEWIGPWFRKRVTPSMGQLETAHVTLAVCTALFVCPELFEPEERRRILEQVRSKGQEPCRRYLEKRMEERGHINNWFMVLLNGFGMASLLLDDREGIERTKEWFAFAQGLYNDDSYGESLQYWNYATLHMSHLYEMLIRYDPSLVKGLDARAYAGSVLWAAYSYLGMKPLEDWGDHTGAPAPRSLNFGDSAYAFRPSGDVLTHIAVRLKEREPRLAGLARWLFDAAYTESDAGPFDRATFGFYNAYDYLSVLLYAKTADPIGPSEAELPLARGFEAGTVVVRDRWEEPRTVLGVQAGYEPLRVTSHNHEDQNSFILTHLGERFFADPGHCCYRLDTQKASVATHSHNTWTFLTEDGCPIVQRPIGGNLFHPEPPKNRRLLLRSEDEVTILRTDAAGVYGDGIVRAERTWITAMPHSVFLVDRIEAAEPIRVQSHFLVDNKDGRLKYNVASDTKLVFRRSPAGMKFFQVGSHSDAETNPCTLKVSWGYMHDAYHPQPNQHGQGREGAAVRFTYTSAEARKSHTQVYAMAMDRIGDIIYWHIRTSEHGTYVIEPPGGKGGFQLQVRANGSVVVTNLNTGAVYEA